MPPPADVRLGPFSREIVLGSAWTDSSLFPASQRWADELEQLLAFAASHGVFERFRPRLQARDREMFSALAEIRVAFFFARNGFKILEWEPQTTASNPADLKVQWQDTEPIIIEIKAPNWQGELRPEELTSGRKKEPKHIHLEGRSVGPHLKVVSSIEKSLPKFSPADINLVVVADDLFISPVELPPGTLEREAAALFKSAPTLVGGVLMLNAVVHSSAVEYEHRFIENETALRPLPNDVLVGLRASSQKYQAVADHRDEVVPVAKPSASPPLGRHQVSGGDLAQAIACPNCGELLMPERADGTTGQSLRCHNAHVFTVRLVGDQVRLVQTD